MTVPAEIILRIVELTSVEPVWLLRGEGPKFRTNAARPTVSNPSGSLDGLATSPITTLLRVALERLEEEERSARDVPGGSRIGARRERDRSEAAEESAGDRGLAGLQEREIPPEAGPDEHESIDGRRAFGKLRMVDDAMTPIVAEGAMIAYAEPEPISEALSDKLVVARIEGLSIVRWFHHCGRFALLRSENPNADPPSILVELDRDDELRSFHRVLWISTPH